MTKTYEVPLTFEELDVIKSALFDSCGPTSADFHKPENEEKRKLWFRFLDITSEERYIRDLVRECDKFGYD